KIIAQFVNALVSFKLGRNYFNNRSIIRTLIWGEIGRDNIEKSTGDNLVGIMTKLSYSRFQCSDMIKNGLLSWLVKHMEEVEYSLSKYHLQCVTALLRNLLRGCNLDNLIPIEITKLIVLLGRYLDTENATAKSFIYDSLGILFQNEKIVKASKELNFQRIIEDHLT
ncbi:LisH domain-containing protein ARMC9, partial [Pseudolycoriella hygida]